ncbi:MAG: O-antigen ligase family protein [Actinobacteria bacterium]|nr:O-antigen ligase family protein [Actinomycetota bacterium]
MIAARIDRGAAAVVAVTAILLAGLAFSTGGAIDVASTGSVLTLVILLVTAAFARAAWTGILPRPFCGSAALLLVALFAALTALSVGWSILPGASYFDATRTIAYVTVIAAGALAAQLLPNRSREFAAGVMIAALTICLYSLFSRIMPTWFPESDAFARLRMPFEYWNAVGAVAVFGIIGSLWLGTARGLGEWPVALSYPAGGVFTVALFLSQSRGSLLAAVLAIGLWLLIAPRRLRSAGWLAVAGGVGVIVTAWAYSRPALSQDAVEMAERKSTGLVFGVILLLMIAVLAAVGLAIERRRRTNPLTPARRFAIGRVLLIALAISPVLLAGAVGVTSDEGFGKITSSVSDMFDPDQSAPANEPGRLTQTSSLRARYWGDAFKIWGDNRLHGTGADSYTAARLPYRKDTVQVRHAHGFVPQTVADLGIWGLLAIAALTIAWFVAMARAAGARRAAPTRWLEGSSDARLADWSLALTAFAFGVHSAVDWTWYMPGVAAFGLVSAGWIFGSGTRLAGRPAVEAAPPAAPATGRRAALLSATGILLIGLATAYAVYQPARATRKVDDGYGLLASGRAQAALESGQDAHDLDPTSDRPYYLIAAAHKELHQPKAADAVLTRIAVVQPANPETWIRLADFRLNESDDPRGAIEALGPLLYLSPNNERGNLMLTLAKERLKQELLREALERERRELKRKIAKLKREARAAAIP